MIDKFEEQNLETKEFLKSVRNYRRSFAKYEFLSSFLCFPVFVIIYSILRLIFVVYVLNMVK